MVRVAVLDDWQKVARKVADWTAVEQRAQVTYLEQPIGGQDATAAALKDFDEAVRLDPQNAVGFVARGNVLVRLNRAEAAVASFDRAIALSPRLASAYYGRGRANLLLGRDQQARTDFVEALRLEPKMEAAQRQLDNLARAAAARQT